MKQFFVKLFNIFWLVGVVGFVVFLVFQIGSDLNLFTGFPKGVDVYAYLFRLKFVSTNFPHIFWNPLWNSGVPSFTWSYPELPIFLALLLRKLFNLSFENSLTASATMAMIFFGFGICCLIYEITKVRTLALFTVVLLFMTNSIWGWWADGGNYPRVISMGFWAMFNFLLIKYLNIKNNDKESKIVWLGIVLFLSLTLTSHLLAGMFALLTGGGLIIFYSEKNRLANLVRIFLPGLLLSFYWLGPLFLTGHQAGSFLGGGVNQGAIGPKNFLNINKDQPFFSWPNGLAVILGLSIGSTILGMFKKSGRKVAKVNLFLIPLLAILLFYEMATLVTGNLTNFFINGLPALSAFFLTSLVAILVIGVGFGSALSLIYNKLLREGVCLLIIGGLIAVYLPSFQQAQKHANRLVRDVGDAAVSDLRVDAWGPMYTFRKLLLGKERDTNYRFGTDTAYVSDWWNWDYPNNPQTKDYFAQGVPYPGWQFWMENAIWKEENNYEETNFLLDWYGIKNFLVGIPNAKVEKFAARESDYSKQKCGIVFNEDACEFVYTKASPILTAVNQPVILMVGKPANYETIFRDWANTGLGSEDIIWLKQINSLGNYNLKNVKAIFLYGYNNTPNDITTKLKTFVESGGGLFIETEREKENNLNLPDPYPVKTIEKGILDKEWGFIVEKNDFEWEINWSDFSEAKVGESSWGVAYGKDIKSWAKKIVSSQNGNLLVAGNYGKGRVVWSGMNLPFHLLMTQNTEELAVFKKLVLWVMDSSDSEEALGRGSSAESDSIVTNENPQKFKITLNSPAKGVLFKESYASGWHAKAGSTKLKIWRAGPDLMYVDLTGVKESPITVEFTYHGFWMEKIALLVSLVTIGLVIDYLLGGRILVKLKIPIKKNWITEEE